MNSVIEKARNYETLFKRRLVGEFGFYGSRARAPLHHKEWLVLQIGGKKGARFSLVYCFE